MRQSTRGTPRRTSLVRRQHVVSRFYLSGFADSQNQLRRVVLAAGESHLVAVGDATVIKDFYNIEFGGGVTDVFERQFSRVEEPAAAALQRVVRERKWPLEPDERNALAAWIALQYLRSEAIRTSQMQMRAETIRLLVGASGKQALRQHIETTEGAAISDARLDAEWADLTQPGGPRLQLDAFGHMRTVVELLPLTVALLVSMQWSLSVFERKTLFTCDHPVVLLPGADHPRGAASASRTPVATRWPSPDA